MEVDAGCHFYAELYLDAKGHQIFHVLPSFEFHNYIGLGWVAPINSMTHETLSLPLLPLMMMMMMKQKENS